MTEKQRIESPTFPELNLTVEQVLAAGELSGAGEVVVTIVHS